MKRLISIILVILVKLAANPVPANAAENAKPVFVHATCNGNIPSNVLASLKQEISASQKYHLIANLNDTSVALTIYMNCAEHSHMIAIATDYGVAKCINDKTCHGSVNGSSIRSVLCDSIAATECGRALFKVFDDYVNRPNSTLLKLD